MTTTLKVNEKLVFVIWLGMVPSQINEGEKSCQYTHKKFRLAIHPVVYQVVDHTRISKS